MDPKLNRFKEESIKNGRKCLAELKEKTERVTIADLEEQDNRSTELYLEEKKLRANKQVTR